jgi:hypothetical protein
MPPLQSCGEPTRAVTPDPDERCHFCPPPSHLNLIQPAPVPKTVAIHTFYRSQKPKCKPMADNVGFMYGDGFGYLRRGSSPLLASPLELKSRRSSSPQQRCQCRTTITTSTGTRGQTPVSRSPVGVAAAVNPHPETSPLRTLRTPLTKPKQQQQQQRSSHLVSPMSVHQSPPNFHPASHCALIPSPLSSPERSTPRIRFWRLSSISVESPSVVSFHFLKKIFSVFFGVSEGVRKIISRCVLGLVVVV